MATYKDVEDIMHKGPEATWMCLMDFSSVIVNQTMFEFRDGEHGEELSSREVKRAMEIVAREFSRLAYDGPRRADKL